MLVKIFFTVDNFEDFFHVSDDTKQQCAELAQDELARRGLDRIENEVWSIEVKYSKLLQC